MYEVAFDLQFSLCPAGGAIKRSDNMEQLFLVIVQMNVLLFTSPLNRKRLKATFIKF